MTRRFVLTLVVVLSGLSLAFDHPQSRTVSFRISDLSSPSSPLRGSGRVTFHEVFSQSNLRVQHKLAGEILNVSSKTILAFDVSVDLFPEERHFFADHFFSSHLLAPNSRCPIEDESKAWFGVPFSGGPLRLPPRPQLHVLFVEFGDGSKYGRSQWGDNLTNARRNEVATLNRLLGEYGTEEQNGLSSAVASALAEPNNPPEIDAILRQIDMVIRSKGSRAAIDKIRDLLANARAHQALQ